MKKLIFLLFLSAFTKSMAHPDSLTFAVLGNSISTYYDYIPSGYSVYYSQDREKSYGIQVGDTWWMQLSRLSGLTFLANFPCKCFMEWQPCGSRCTQQKCTISQ